RFSPIHTFSVSETTMRRQSEAFRSEALVASDRDIVALVAHELKHPLSAIEAALPLMGDAPRATSRQKARRVIERQLKYLRRLINDLLDEEKVRRGELHLEARRIDLRSVVADAAFAFGPLAKQRGVTLSKALPLAPAIVSGDILRLQQAVANVLDNAVKHTSAGGKIGLRLKIVDSQAMISVNDTGAGIPAAALPHIFEPFRYDRN